MPKDQLIDYDSNAANNTDCGSVNLAENSMLPSDVNNYAREIMSHLKEFADGTSGINVLSLTDDTDTNQIKVQAPSSVTTTTTFTLPDGDGSADQVLKTDGSGQLGFADRHANPSLVINGQMTVAQRGTSSTGSGIGCVDRFTHSYVGGTVTSSQESLTSSDTPYSLGFRHYIRMANDATTSVANAQRQIYQNIEAQNIANSGWNYTSSSSYVTVSFWVRSSLAGKYGAYLLTYDGTAQQFSFTYTLSANTWTKVTKTIPGNSNLTFDNDNGLGMSLVVYSWLGTDYTDSTATMDAWVTNDSTKYFEEDLADWAGTLNATLDVTGVKLELGQTATNFVHQPYSEVLKQCERYYELVGTAVYVGATSYGFSGTEYIVNSNWFEIDWKTEKRTDSVSVNFINGFGWSSSPANSGAGRYGAAWYKGTSFIAQVAGDKTGLPIASVSAEV